jgi:hypothetical protein
MMTQIGTAARFALIDGARAPVRARREPAVVAALLAWRRG